MSGVYSATIRSVYDGDTVHADVALGVLGLTLTNYRIRFVGCNARELAAPGGPEARDHLAGVLPVGTVVTLTVPGQGNDEYGGRLDAGVALADGTDLVAKLIADQWAAAWDGKHDPAPVPPWPRPVAAAWPPIAMYSCVTCHVSAGQPHRLACATLARDAGVTPAP